jgi:hypothetical protein
MIRLGPKAPAQIILNEKNHLLRRKHRGGFVLAGQRLVGLP